MSQFALLFSAFAISFAGSIPPGTVNLTILNAGGKLGWQKSVVWAFWASAIELIHLSTALYLYFQLNQIAGLQLYGRPFAALVLAGLGLVLLIKKPNANTGHFITIKRFVLINLLNPMAIPFWLGVLQLMAPEASQSPVVILGSFFGAWLCLSLFGIVGIFVERIGMISAKVLNVGIGSTLLGLAVWQSILFCKDFMAISAPPQHY